MMKSESEGAFAVTGTPKTYGSLHSARAGRRPTPVVLEAGSLPVNEGTIERPTAFFRRGVIAVGVILFFGVTLSAARLRWATGGWVEDNPPSAAGEKSIGIFVEVPKPEIFKPAAIRPEVGTLTLEASNEYGASDHHALALYGLEMLIEPYRPTTLWVEHSTVPSAARQSGTQFHWLLLPASDDGTADENGEPIINSRGGSHATVQLKHPGKIFNLRVQQVQLDGEVVAEGSAVVACKYVRRELRELTDNDRTEFFEAMREFYTVSVEDGLEKYGPDFTNYLTTTGYHNSEKYCYHNGMHFLTAHTAFNLWVERSLQLINPRVSLAFWDFMIESGTLGARWPRSDIFSSDMYGSAIGSKETNYQIKDGWFANISSIYDPDHDEIISIIDTNHNAYGYITAGYNYQDLPYVTRTHSYCELVGESSFVGCDVFVGCFTDSTSLYDWAVCMERSVHASMHGMIGGGFDCNVDMDQFLQEHPEYSRGLLTFVLEFIVANKWPGNVLMRLYNTCDTECTPGQTEPCGCTCNIDPFQMSDDEVREFMDRSMMALHQRSGGDRYVDEDDTAEWPYNFMAVCDVSPTVKHGCERYSMIDIRNVDPSETLMPSWYLRPQLCKTVPCYRYTPAARDTLTSIFLAERVVPLQDDTRMTDEQTLLLLRVMMSVACEPGSIGAMSGGASPADPIFWVLHPIFEKALHVLLLSPEYANNYDFTWVNGTCDGSKLHDTVPFTEKELGFSEDTEFLRNDQLLELFNPTKNTLTYMYDSFMDWGLCHDWDPCPECADSNSPEDGSRATPVQIANMRQRTGARRLPTQVQ